MKTFWSTIWAILKEISDESAYQRHLRLHNREHSPTEWRKFSDQRLSEKYARAKCC